MDRRTFISGGLALGAGVFLGGCGNDSREIRTAEQPATSLEQLPINDAAKAGAVATRERPPQLPESPQIWTPGQFITSVNLDFNGMALNYDDGPSPYNTEPILRTLAKYGIKATFFIIGINARTWPEILQRIVDEGHEIGNHSMFHSPYTALALSGQIEPNQELLYELCRVRPVANRAPGLTHGDLILNACRRNNMYEVHTTIDSLDYQSPRIPATSIAGNIARQLHPGAIPLQHDGGNRRPTPDAQEMIIQDAKNRGYEFFTVTDLINQGTPLPRSGNYTNSLPNQAVTECMACSYDPAVELRKRLDDPTVKKPEINRINESLAELEAFARAA